jgi:hypothetical protein
MLGQSTGISGITGTVYAVAEYMGRVYVGGQFIGFNDSPSTPVNFLASFG